jgi:hypothetical protein
MLIFIEKSTLEYIFSLISQPYNIISQEKHTIKKTKLVKKVALCYHDIISPFPSIILPNTCCTTNLE